MVNDLLNMPFSNWEEISYKDKILIAESVYKEIKDLENKSNKTLEEKTRYMLLKTAEYMYDLNKILRS